MISEKIWNNLDKILGIIGLISGFVALTIGLKISNFMLQQVSIILISSTSIYLLYRRSFTTNENNANFYNSHRIFNITLIFFNMLFVFALILFYSGYYSRPIIFLLISSIMAGILAISIYHAANDFQYTFILFEIFTLGLLLRTTAFFQFPTLIGADPWAHADWIQSLSEIGNISEAMPAYQSFPLMHVFVTYIHSLSTLTIKESMAFVGFLGTISLIFLYLIAQLFFNKKIGLILILLMILSASNILYGYIIIPQSFGIIYILLLLFFLISQSIITTDASKKYLICTIILLPALLFSHSIASFAFLVLLISIFIVDILCHILSPDHLKWSKIIIYCSILFSILIIEYWSYASGFSRFVIDSIKWGFSYADLAPPTTTLSADFLQSAMTQLPLYLIIFFAIIGSLYLIKKGKNLPFMIYGWGIVIFVFISFFLGLNNFLPGRWLVFISLTLSVPLAISVILLANIFSRKAVAIFFIVSFFAVIMVTNYEANVTNVNPWTPYPTQAFIQSEVTASTTLSTIAPDKFNVLTDDYYIRLFNHNYSINNGNKVLLQNVDLHGFFFLRDEIINNVCFANLNGGGHNSIYNVDISDVKFLKEGSKFYDCGTVFGYFD